MLIGMLGAGCGVIFSDRKPTPKLKIALNKRLHSEWTVLVPDPPLTTTADIHLIGLKLKGVQGWADEDHKIIRLKDGSDIQIEVDMVDDKGISTRLYPNGIGEYLEFGKRSEIKGARGPDFQPGETFNKIMFRSSKPIDVEEVVWMEFEF